MNTILLQLTIHFFKTIQHYNSQILSLTDSLIGIGVMQLESQIATRGGGALPLVGYTGRLRPKAVPFIARGM